MIVDAHQHFWNFERIPYHWPTPDTPTIYRTIEAPELEPLLKECGIDKTVIVQAMNAYADTDYMLEVAEQYPWVAGVVGWVPLDRPDEASRKLETYLKNPYFKGVRHLNHEEPDPDWVVRPDVMEGLKVLAAAGVPYDLVAVFPEHLKHVPALAEAIPNLRLVIDHLAKPPIREGLFQAWADAMSIAAQYPNVYAKVSGLNTAAEWVRWTADDIKPYIDHAWGVFGSDRLMFGSDWPVANLAGDYKKVWSETNRAIAEYSKEDRESILGGTAIKFYGL
ncbi:amidohydrolase family protein [Paenibacillus chartarius]|uniref:Amidohydrolase family protein n=1 Tax=Paenibacillus chartarius TaxID=747481 RepID=A0ABV6DLV3_9BACL